MTYIVDQVRIQCDELQTDPIRLYVMTELLYLRVLGTCRTFSIQTSFIVSLKNIKADSRFPFLHTAAAAYGNKPDGCRDL